MKYEIAKTFILVIQLLLQFQLDFLSLKSTRRLLREIHNE